MAESIANNNVVITPVLLKDFSLSNRQKLLAAINHSWQHSWGFPRYPSLQALEKEILPPSNHWLVVTENNQFTGGVYYVVDQDALYFGTLWVSPDTRTRGLGSTLINHLEDKARVLSKTRIHIVVNPAFERLIQFYEKRGYIGMGPSKQFPGFMHMEKTF